LLRSAAVLRTALLVALPLGLTLLGACSGDDGGAAAETAAPATAGSTGSSATAASTGRSTGTAGAGSDGSSGIADSSDGSSGEPSGYLDVYEISGDEVYPEGIAFDTSGEAFFFGSLSDGAVRRMDVEGNQTDFAAGPPGAWSSRGLKVDARNGRVWVCATETRVGTEAVWVLDLATGDVVEVFELADSDPAAGCNDLALDGAGVAYVSDPPLGAVHRITAGGADEIWATDPAWAPLPGLGLGVNGLAVTPDGNYLIQGMYSPQSLFRVALADGTDITPIDLSGDNFGGATPIAGVDGIVFNDDALFVVFADVVKRVDFDDDWTTGSVTTVEVPDVGDGLSTATVAAGAVYVVKSEVTAFVLGSDPDLPFEIVRVP